tara:strand:+ start:6235 stop:7134 length:900 start_codon:yes stop_codon:yes gene_type:complete
MSSFRNKRIQSDIKNLYNNPIENVFFHVNEDDMANLQFMIIGPEDTPYHLGFFIFDLIIPEKYPFYPPKVKFLSTNGEIRFHPFLYENGKVCLSLLNTWAGPQWTSAQTLHSIIVSIQSIFTNKALRDEPGHTYDSNSLVNIYNNIIEFHTLQYSILTQIQKKIFPVFYDDQIALFSKNYKFLSKKINNLIINTPHKIPSLFKTRNSLLNIEYSYDKTKWTYYCIIFGYETDNILYEIITKLDSFKINVIHPVLLSNNETVYIKIKNYTIFAPYPFINMNTDFNYKLIHKKLKYLKTKI